MFDIDISLAPSELREIALDAALAAVDVVAGSSSHAPLATKSTATDIVTATDIAAEEVVRRVIAERAPGSDVLGEEGGHVPGGDGPHGDIEWVVDPLDGTVNFAYRIPLNAVSVAAAVAGTPLAGVVVDVSRREVFSAHLGGGAWLGDDRITVGDRVELAEALAATGFAYDAERRLAHGSRIAQLLGQVRDVRAFGSAALHLCWVACARIDIYVERDIRPWDHCAGGLIATEAGAQLELPCAENDGIVLAANPTLHDLVRPLVI